MSKLAKTWVAAILALTILIMAASPAFAAGEDRIQFGNNIEVLPDQTVDGNMVTFGGNISVAGRVFGDVTAVVGNVDVSGEVIGQVVSIGGNVHLASTARVQRGVTVIGGTLQREEGAEVRGQITEAGRNSGVRPWVWPWTFSPGVERGPHDAFSVVLGIFSSLLVAVTLAAIALLAAVIFPVQLDVVRRTIESAPLQVLGVGVLSAILSVVLTPILIFTCIGLPLFWLAVVIGTLFGLAGVALLAGERLLLAINVTNFTPVTAAVVGILVIWIASLLPVLGGILMLFVFFFGLGAVVLSRFGTTSPPFSWQTGGSSRGTPPRE